MNRSISFEISAKKGSQRKAPRITLSVGPQRAVAVPAVVGYKNLRTQIRTMEVKKKKKHQRQNFGKIGQK